MKNKKEWNSIPNSVKFWNGLLILLFIAAGIWEVALLGVIAIIGSIVALGLIIDDKTENHLWIWLMPLMWILCIFVLIMLLGAYIVKKTIIPFNDWIDKKK